MHTHILHIWLVRICGYVWLYFLRFGWLFCLVTFGLVARLRLLCGWLIPSWLRWLPVGCYIWFTFTFPVTVVVYATFCGLFTVAFDSTRLVGYPVAFWFRLFTFGSGYVGYHVYTRCALVTRYGLRSFVTVTVAFTILRLHTFAVTFVCRFDFATFWLPFGSFTPVCAYTLVGLCGYGYTRTFYTPVYGYHTHGCRFRLPVWLVTHTPRLVYRLRYPVVMRTHTPRAAVTFTFTVWFTHVTHTRLVVARLRSVTVGCPGCYVYVYVCVAFYHGYIWFVYIRLVTLRWLRCWFGWLPRLHTRLRLLRFILHVYCLPHVYGLRAHCGWLVYVGYGLHVWLYVYTLRTVCYTGCSVYRLRLRLVAAAVYSSGSVTRCCRLVIYPFWFAHAGSHTHTFSLRSDVFGCCTVTFTLWLFAHPILRLRLHTRFVVTVGYVRLRYTHGYGSGYGWLRYVGSHTTQFTHVGWLGYSYRTHTTTRTAARTRTHTCARALHRTPAHHTTHTHTPTWLWLHTRFTHHTVRSRLHPTRFWFSSVRVLVTVLRFLGYGYRAYALPVFSLHCGWVRGLVVTVPLPGSWLVLRF